MPPSSRGHLASDRSATFTRLGIELQGLDARLVSFYSTFNR